MNKTLKIILLGLLIWVIPFLVSFFVWDVESNAPSVPINLFNSIMVFSWSIGFAIALVVFFKKSKSPSGDGWKAGITWYVILVLMDLIVLAGVFGMTLTDWSYMLLTYLNTLILTVVIGKIISKK